MSSCLLHRIKNTPRSHIMGIKGRSFNLKPIRNLPKKLAAYKWHPKSARHVGSVITSNSKLKSVIRKVFSRKAALAAGFATVTGFSAASIWNYIEANSGCFRKLGNGSVCKVKELSCCQRNTLDNVTNCAGMSAFGSVCDDYNDATAASCCKLCSCEELQCHDNEEFQCQKPTVADAIAHFSQKVKSGVWSAIETVFPWASYVLYAVGTMLALWLLGMALPIINKILPRARSSRNQDV